MSSKKGIIIIIAVFAIIVAGAALLYKAMPAPDNSAEAPAKSTADVVAAPNFTMLDAEGNTVALTDFVGTPIVLNFWASWCGPCKDEMPVFDALAAEMGDSVRFLMVNLTDGRRDTVEGVAEFIANKGYSFPVYYDTENEGAAAYAVRSIPMTYFIDAEGNVLAYHAGGISENSLRQGIELISE